MQWISSSLGHFFATIGGDNRFKLWQEDLSQRVTKGRRFRCIYSQSPPNHVSYVSFGFKTFQQEIWLALMTHDGLLGLFEPAEPESFASWNAIDKIYPFGQHNRGTEARFRLSVQQAENPSLNAISAGLDPRALSLAVSAMSVIKILRAIKPHDPSEGNYQLQEVLLFELNTTFINEVAWAPGCHYPVDVIAAACDDGTVRIVHVDTLSGPEPSNELAAELHRRNDSTGRKVSSTGNKPSGIAVGLARAASNETSRYSVRDEISLQHVASEAATLFHGDSSAVWKVRWIYDGERTLILPFRECLD